MIQPFSGIDQKGFVDDLLATLDTNIVELYHSFLVAVDNKQFFEPQATCADTLYKQLIEIEEFEPLHNHLRRNYAAALQDDAQQMINRLVFKPDKEVSIWYSPKRMRKTYGPYPRMLDRAAELLGPDHYMFSVLKARKAFFEGGLIYLERFKTRDPQNGEKAIKKFRESLEWQPNAPHTFMWMASTFLINLNQPDSADLYTQKAVELAPSWRLPLYLHAINYCEQRNLKKAKIIIDSLSVIDSTDINYWHAMAYVYLVSGKYDKVVEAADKMGEIDSTELHHPLKILAYGFLGKKEEALEVFNVVAKRNNQSAFPYYHLGNMYYLKGEVENAIPYFEKALELDSSLMYSYPHLGEALMILKKYDEAESILWKGFQKDSTYIPLLNALGGVYAGKNELEKAEYFYTKAIDLDSYSSIPYYNLAMVQARQNKATEAIENLETFLQKGGTRYYDHIKNNTDLDPIRNDDGFKELMKKYFPEKE